MNRLEARLVEVLGNFDVERCTCAGGVCRRTVSSLAATFAVLPDRESQRVAIAILDAAKTAKGPSDFLILANEVTLFTGPTDTDDYLEMTAAYLTGLSVDRYSEALEEAIMVAFRRQQTRALERKVAAVATEMGSFVVAQDCAELLHLCIDRGLEHLVEQCLERTEALASAAPIISVLKPFWSCQTPNVATLVRVA